MGTFHPKSSELHCCCLISLSLKKYTTSICLSCCAFTILQLGVVGEAYQDMHSSSRDGPQHNKVEPLLHSHHDVDLLRIFERRASNCCTMTHATVQMHQ